MNEGLSELEREIGQLPAPVLEAFQQARERTEPKLSNAELLAWAQWGVAIALLPVRSWDAASEYFRATPVVCQYLSATQLMDWAQHGSLLCQDSPTLAAAFFRASAGTVPHLAPQRIGGWATLGRSLYKGTWKSSTLSTKFFEATPDLAAHLSYSDIEQFVALLRTLSQKSWDLATECLALGMELFPKLDVDGHALIDLGTVLAERSWREVKGCFEGMPRLLTNVQKEHRGRFLRLAERLARSGMTNIAAFLSQGSTALGRVDHGNQGHLFDLAERLPPTSSEAVAALLRGSPTVLNRISASQMENWFETGLGILQDNPDGGLAYFRLESSTSEQALEALSSAVELERAQDVLRMYCRALAGANIDIVPTKELVAKNIGWVSEASAATDGTTVYLPPRVDRYNAKAMNFTLLKVVSTHQVGHIEFGSFDFSFDTTSERFPDRRWEREAELSATPIDRSESEHHEQRDAASDAPTEASQSAERGFLTDMGRFFDLFPKRKLALDIFTATEDGRLDYRVKADYPGLSAMYRRVQLDALAERPRIEAMPAQEAMVEFLVRLSLQQNRGLPCPKEFMEEAKAIALVAERLLYTDAMVEDSAEATIRIYDLIEAIPNEAVPEEEWGEVDAEQPEMSLEELEQLLAELKGRSAPGASSEQQEQQEQPYDSPPQIDYRGDFKPELAQLLSSLRAQQGQQGETQDDVEPSREMLEQLLASSVELELGAEEGQLDTELGAFAQNIMKEAGVAPPTPGQGYGPTAHQQDDGRPLEAKEPKTFVYDEWDFRAADFKPRWCIVREKPMAEGDPQFYSDTLRNYAHVVAKIRRQFEMIMPETFRKIKHVQDGEEFDLDSVVESIIDRWCGVQPSDKLYWRRNKVQRDVAVVFLMDMSASTAEAIDESSHTSNDWDAPDDPAEYMVWLRGRRGERAQRNVKRIIDLEKESTVLLINALESIGDVYGIYGFSGYGRENVEFYVIKDIEESFGDAAKRRIDKITPLHATRMGPAIRHATSKLERQTARTKLMFLISDGRPQDRGYSREGVEKEYAVHDTKMALTEARRKGITPFCLTVDKAGHDYLKTMCQDMGYEILDDVTALPSRLPMLYRKLSV